MYVERSPDRRPKLRGKRILVVEDVALISMVVEDELLGAGATVVGPVASVVDALRVVERLEADGGIDAAVLEIKVGGKHVAPLADRLAALGVPFLFATGYSAACDTGGHGAAPRLLKPFDPKGLVAAVEALASVAV